MKKQEKNNKKLDLPTVINSLTRKQKIESSIEGLEWHLKILKGYKITNKSCNPQNILNQIKKEEAELLQLRQELNFLRSDFQEILIMLIDDLHTSLMYKEIEGIMEHIENLNISDQ